MKALSYSAPMIFLLEYLIDILAYDVDNADNRIFKVARIHEIEVTDTDWPGGGCEDFGGRQP